MTQKDNFSGGFLLGTIVGGVVGGCIGALLASRQLTELESEEPLLSSGQPESKPIRKKRSLKASNGQGSMEVARRSLEDKIAQLNEAIDDVRQQLGGMHEATPDQEHERTLPRDP
jgi:gas vesicle protein